MPKYIADRKLWLTADRERVVEDGDPEARFLLAAPGRAVPEEQAVRLGLLTVRQVTDRVRADLAEASAAGSTKRRRQPVADKEVAAGEGSEDKSAEGDTADAGDNGGDDGDTGDGGDAGGDE